MMGDEHRIKFQIYKPGINGEKFEDVISEGNRTPNFFSLNSNKTRVKTKLAISRFDTVPIVLEFTHLLHKNYIYIQRIMRKS